VRRVAAFRAQQRMKEARAQFEELHRLAHGEQQPVVAP